MPRYRVIEDEKALGHYRVQDTHTMHTELLKVASAIAKRNPNYKFHIDMNDAVVGLEQDGEIKPFLAGAINGMVLPYHDTLVNGEPLVHKNWAPIAVIEEVTA